MDRRDAALSFSSALRGSLFTVAAGLVAWCAPAMGSTGVVIECEEAANMPALIETVSQPAAIEKVEQDEADTVDKVEAESPKVTTRSPGLSDAVLPNFRRQMLRTDI